MVIRITGPADLRGTAVLLMEHEETEQKIPPDAESTDWSFTLSPRLRGR